MTRFFIGSVVMILGFFAGVLLIVAGIQLQSHGQSMADIQSQATASGGTGSVAEVYYNESGYCNKAFGLATCGVGLAVIAASVGLGGLLWKSGHESPAEILEEPDGMPRVT